jgi:hypothetical protein
MGDQAKKAQLFMTLCIVNQSLQSLEPSELLFLYLRPDLRRNELQELKKEIISRFRGKRKDIERFSRQGWECLCGTGANTRLKDLEAFFAEDKKEYKKSGTSHSRVFEQ